MNAASARNAVSLLKILTLDPDPAGHVKVLAQYNPKEVQIDGAVKWEDHPAKDGALGVEFGAKSARTMSIELLFDGAEDPGSVRTVRDRLDDLESLTAILGKDKDKHPPRVMVVWGENADESLPRFPAVIESISVKYQMFSASGRVLRATANVKLKESGLIGIKKPKR